MKKLMLLAMATGVVYQAAKYLGINSVADVKKLVLPHLKGVIPA